MQLGHPVQVILPQRPSHRGSAGNKLPSTATNAQCRTGTGRCDWQATGEGGNDLFQQGRIKNPPSAPARYGEVPSAGL